MNLTTRILHFMQNQEEDFNSLALAVFEYQFKHCAAYQHYCQQLQLTPSTVKNWYDVPSVPTDVFREFDLCTFDTTEANYVFQTSGTTQESKGKHFYRDMTLYDEAIRLSFMNGIGLHPNDRIAFRILTPAFTEVNTSSLFYMLHRAVEWYGDASSRFYMVNNQWDYTALQQDLKDDVKKQRPVALIGTAFSFVQLFDFFAEKKWELPKSSVLMETGGFKGKTRIVAKNELYQLFETQLGIPQNRCFSEYGMTELSSQCYSNTQNHLLQSPPWMKVRLIHPESGKEVSIGETGIIQFFDLANLEAIAAVTTADLGVRHEDGFELLGRAPLAVLRGCSLAFERDSL